MPRYEFTCNQCQEQFELNMSIGDRETAVMTCPECESEDVSQIFRTLNIIKSRSRSFDSDRSCAGCGGSGCCG